MALIPGAPRTAQGRLRHLRFGFAVKECRNQRDETWQVESDEGVWGDESKSPSSVSTAPTLCRPSLRPCKHRTARSGRTLAKIDRIRTLAGAPGAGYQVKSSGGREEREREENEVNP